MLARQAGPELSQSQREPREGGQWAAALFLWADKSGCIHVGAQLGNEKAVKLLLVPGSWVSPPRRNAWIKQGEQGVSPAQANLVGCLHFLCSCFCSEQLTGWMAGAVLGGENSSLNSYSFFLTLGPDTPSTGPQRREGRFPGGSWPRD